MTRDMEKVARGLLGIAKCHNKIYCYVGQENFQVLLGKYEDWNRSERTLRRRIKDLVDQGYIRVVHRNWSEENGSKKFKCNLYFFTKKLFKWFEKVERVVRKVFSFFRRPKMANYSSKPIGRDLRKTPPVVEILWKTQEKGRASPVESII
jgi:DNA-binding Lrp family transcriptional regulator